MLKRFLVLLATMPTFAANLKIPVSPQPYWTAPVGLHPMYRDEPPVLHNGRLYFIAHNDFRNHIYCLDARSGSVVWKSAFRAQHMSLSPDDSLRVFTLDRYYVGLYTDTGREFDRNDILNSPGVSSSNFQPLNTNGLTITTAPSGELVAFSPQGELWRAQTGWGSSLDATPPLAYKDLVLTGVGSSTTHDRNGLKAYQQRTGVLAWSAAEVHDARRIKLHRDVVLVYEDHWRDPNTFTPMVRAVDAATGRQLWSDSTMINRDLPFDTIAWPVEKSQSEGDILILPCSGTLRVVDLHSGAARFKFPLNSAGFALSGGVVYAPDGKQVVAIDPSNGGVMWRSNPFRDRPGTPIASAGFLYAGDRGSVAAWAIP
jgi:outer membrane protein assembly factor BamB